MLPDTHARLAARPDRKVAAVIVTYRPDLAMVERIVRRLVGQCAIVVADNSPDQADADAVSTLVEGLGAGYAWMGGNAGIGAAQNQAIARAWDGGCDAVLLLDDDSLPPGDIVAQLVDCQSRAGPDAVVGANALNEEGHEISNARSIPGVLPRCRDLMSSGTLISKPIFDKVGWFDEGLFVDGVDFDWGWRARRMGFELFLCRSTAIVHRLGQGRVAGAGIPSPVRHYFQYRNMIRLMGRPHTPWRWRFEQFIKLPSKVALILLFMPQRGLRLRHAIAGIADGLRGRHGPHPAAGARL